MPAHRPYARATPAQVPSNSPAAADVHPLLPRLPVHRLALFTFLALGACNDTTKPRTIDTKREIQVADTDLQLRATQQQRFGLRPMGPASTTPGANTPPADDTPALKWNLPPGWTEKPASAMRQANFQVPGDPKAECYMTMLGGEGGGLAANLNRWRTQMHQPAYTADELAKLPTLELFGRPATFVDISGDFTGMNATEKLTGQRLVGLALVEPGGSVFLKMTGPANVVGDQLEAFKQLASSFHLEARARDPHAAVDPHANVDMGDGSMKPPPPSGTTSTVNRGSGIAWTPPAGWTRAPDRSTRVCSYMVDGKDDLQCYITVLAGDAGGALANVNRWRKQLGRDDLTQADLAALPQGKMLGVPAVLVEIPGKASADSTTADDALLLGAVCVRPRDSVFVKLSGPSARVAAQRESFRAFCASLVEAP